MIRDLKTDIENAVEPVLNQEGFDLIEIKLSRYKKSYRLQIFVDSDHGVTLDECAHLSRLVGTVLDTDDVIESQYILELSSPGLDRPLHSDRDFRRRIGDTVRLDIMANGESKKLTGTLTAVENEMLYLSVKNKDVQVPLAEVQQGKIII